MQELSSALASGKDVKLVRNITLTDNASLRIPAGKDVTLDLNGFTISGNNKSDALIINEGNLVIIGDVNSKIVNNKENGSALINNKGTMTLKGGNLQGAPIGTTGHPSYAVNTSGTLIVEEGTVIAADRGAISMNDGADVTINGGNIYVTDALGNRVLTSHVIYAYGSNSSLTINDGNFALNYVAPKTAGASVICPAGATINVYNGNFSYAGVVGQGGIFQNYMGYGAPVNVYGGTYTDNTVTKNVATGYKAEFIDGIYHVKSE